MEPIEAMYCEFCGSTLKTEAHFCPKCGNAVRAETHDEAPVSWASFFGALVTRLSDGAIVVLVLDPAARRRRRFEGLWDAESEAFEGMIATHASDLFEDALDADSYVLAEIECEDEDSRFCVWHLIGGVEVPLSSEAAAALVEIYPALLPHADDAAGERIEFVMAPALLSDG
jgi:ribosomal protein S27AE